MLHVIEGHSSVRQTTATLSPVTAMTPDSPENILTDWRQAKAEFSSHQLFNVFAAKVCALLSRGMHCFQSAELIEDKILKTLILQAEAVAQQTVHEAHVAFAPALSAIAAERQASECADKVLLADIKTYNSAASIVLQVAELFESHQLDENHQERRAKDIHKAVAEIADHIKVRRNVVWPNAQGPHLVVS